MSEEPMEVDETKAKWGHVLRLLTRGGPLAHPEFEPSSETLGFMRDTCRILVVGAGGLGCELLKDLALMGFWKLDVIDMDTIDVSNLNRQFLFRRDDVGKSKADVASAFVERRIPGAVVTPHFARIQDFGQNFYSKFHVVVCGLDAIIARRWINGMLISLLRYDPDSRELDPSSIIPLVDGGTEGFKGNARVILPGMTACIDCTIELYPPQVVYPMCTVAHTPRLPEHCIEYAKVLLWPQEKPFGDGKPIDGDDPVHIQWLFDKAQERAKAYNIHGVTYRLTQGVVKNIIPAVASTNAVIAATCANEVFKIATSCCLPLNNYMVFNDAEGIYTYSYEAERKEDCLACSSKPQLLRFHDSVTLQDVVTYLTDSAAYQMRAPGITAMVSGKSKTLYMQSVESIRQATKDNLKKSLKELGIEDGHELVVADATTPKSLIFNVQFVVDME
ncbi:NEDD8-activating enzyme E1 catalytic subunit-like [Corticium candelabrum]|uniref:NEDD8-activating enzyme E1 catalytic subunit-like n=1 Tax=Corticium candelabrum TaxID=121492 RepID=UPI002E274E10|nr:NEDD8-activating enzyme E1 catalytic subunit-like [Corticium candelabrum]